jgi:dolichyl-phosphate-mannose--protein O-mannosyl transferase
MSFREKTAWISLIALLVLIAWYFRPFLHGAQHGNTLAFGRLVMAAVVVVILGTVVKTVVAAFTPKAEKLSPDEREKLIETKSRRVSYAVLGWCVRGACFFGIADPVLFFNGNTLLFFLMISEVLGIGYQIVQFRRGA